MTATRALRLDPRAPVLPVADRGRTMNAAEVARDVCDGRCSPKTVIQRFRHLAFKSGRELLWYELEIKAAYAEFVDAQRKRA